jgi:hypothetical protein
MDEEVPDDRIYDAINVFKFSRVGRGTAHISGDREYRERYRRLVREILAKLWRLWAADEIGFRDLDARIVGDSSPGREGPDIRVNRRITPSTDPILYATEEHQGRLAAVSCNLVHEGAHLVRPTRSLPEQEMLCRTAQLLYFRELQTGCTYTSRLTGGECTALFTPTTRYYSAYTRDCERLDHGTLIDRVILDRDYRVDLTTSRTAAFIARSLTWWGGLSNRKPKTRGYYLRSLAAQSTDYAPEILDILESLDPADWPDARSCAGNMTRIQQALRLDDYGGESYHLGRTLHYGSDFAERIRVVQEDLGEWLGVS